MMDTNTLAETFPTIYAAYTRHCEEFGIKKQSPLLAEFSDEHLNRLRAIERTLAGLPELTQDKFFIGKGLGDDVDNDVTTNCPLENYFLSDLIGYLRWLP